MKIARFTYHLFYTTGFLTMLAAIFAQDILIYFKPFVIITLGLLYLANTENKNYVVLTSLFLLLICEILFLQDYLGNFEILHVLLSIYYALNIGLLWKSLQLIKIKLKKIFTLQLLISMALIIYVLYSVAQLILPRVDDHHVVLIMLIFFFSLFIGVCYYIYLNSKTIISYSLMVAASCFLIVNILAALNRLYVSIEVFSIINNLLQIFGQFFLVKFFIDQHKLLPNEEDYF